MNRCPLGMAYWGAAVLFALGCASNAEPELERIGRHERALQAALIHMEGEGVLEAMEDVVSALLRDYASYANAHRGDSLATQFLMKRADLLEGKGSLLEAERQWLDLADGLRDPVVTPEAMFRLGFLRESALFDTTGALEAYAEILRLYPESPWAEQAAQSSKWLTFSESEFLRAIRENQP